MIHMYGEPYEKRRASLSTGLEPRAAVRVSRAESGLFQQVQGAGIAAGCSAGGQRGNTDDARTARAGGLAAPRPDRSGRAARVGDGAIDEGGG